MGKGTGGAYPLLAAGAVLRLEDPLPKFRGSGVYEIRNTVTGAAYIGASMYIFSRLRHHLAALRAGRHGKEAMQRDWDTYGSGAFEARILHSVPHTASSAFHAPGVLALEEMYMRERAPSYNQGYEIENDSATVRIER